MQHYTVLAGFIQKNQKRDCPSFGSKIISKHKSNN